MIYCLFRLLAKLVCSHSHCLYFVLLVDEQSSMLPYKAPY
ncbi:hypothetical protein SLEP1_g27042 [Rubroshorea leprosula]|uniref:Photosystem II protein I n=1 Tax=Rubroshorea leprosula TaxID=152421 RepID=A0AAV5JRZ7_9ROSI|nr:hypothetical protein SLEP1_g27042 [Rubroshorea leprosula]